MAKIKTIQIQNFKSIKNIKADFNGCTAIITGGNNKGKTSLLRGIVDRIRFIRPEIIVKEGEKEGRGELTLDTGEKFVWEYDIEGKDKLTYIADDGRKSVTKDLGAQFFPPLFDIDKFLQSPPKAQVKQLQAIVGLDFTDIDNRYEKAYDFRAERNREAEIYHAKLEKMMVAEKYESVDVLGLEIAKNVEKKEFEILYKENKASNQKLRDNWNQEKAKIDQEVAKFNQEQKQARELFEKLNSALTVLKQNGYSGDANEWIINFQIRIQKDQFANDLYPDDPDYIEEMPDRTKLDEIEAKLLEASQINAKAQKYTEYIEYKAEVDQAKEYARQTDVEVKTIEAEKKALVESAKMPEGIEIGPDGILVDKLPLNRTQLSTSALYTAALRIAAMNLGEVKTLYFDASFLDNISLEEIEKWAAKNDLQLLIEQPDRDGGEIKYELIES